MVTAHVVPAGPVGLVADSEGAVWAILPATGTVVQVSDPDPDAAPADVGVTPLRATNADESLWVTAYWPKSIPRPGRWDGCWR